MKYKWGNHYGEIYKPNVNRKRQLILISFIGLTTLLPGPNFIGLGILKLVPMGWVYG